MKLALGSAQWGLNYGINNSSGLISDFDLKRINSFISKNKIQIIDTAYEYGSAEFRIGSSICKSVNIVSKFGNTKKNGSIKNQLVKSLLNLQLDRLYAYIFHDVNELINNKYLWEELKLIKSNGKIEKIGYSIYDTKELDFLIDNNCIPDIIQLPFNILDKKFLDYLPILKKMQIEIHVRSIFLQGLFFKDSSNLNGNLINLKRPLKILENIAKKYNTEVKEIALHYAFSKDDIDYIIIGVDNFMQLKEILKIINKPFNYNIIDEIENISLNSKQTHLLNPSNWIK